MPGRMDGKCASVNMAIDVGMQGPGPGDGDSV